MARHVFTAKDLEPLLGFLNTPLARDALARAVPIRRIGTPAGEVEIIELPVPVRSRDEPDGVPLAVLMESVRRLTPDVTGLSVQDGVLRVTHGRPPTAAQRTRLHRLLGDANQLRRLVPAPPSPLPSPLPTPLPTPPPAPLPRPPQAEAVSDEERLRDEALSDEEWLRAFRRYAVDHLIGPR